MSQGSKNVRPSGLPVRAPRKIPVMSSIRPRTTECSTDAANNNSFPREQIGSSRSRLGNLTNSRNIPDFKRAITKVPQPQPKPISIPKRKCSEVGISGSVPDLSKISKRAGSIASVTPKIAPKTQSAENLNKIGENVKAKPDGKIALVNRSIPKSISMGTFRLGELKRLKVKENLEQVNKRKFFCLENAPGGSKSKELLSPNPFSSPPQPKNLMEDCAKIVKKILLEKRITDVGESKRSSSEFDESIGTFNSDEIMDLFGGDLPRKRLECGKDKRNSSEFEDSIGSFFSDHLGLNFSKSNEFLNLKQSLCHENQLALSISEDIDNLTPGFSDLSNAIDHTPSVEDLPMECEMESGTTAGAEPNANVSARSPSPTDELPLSSRTPNAAVSIITSITSIMSLDTGYQGDGELSRPESRNAETEMRLLKLPQEGLQVKGINFDDGKTMTDSDFFTESDADIHDDLSAAAAEIGSGKGDRKAQVIDGTLYGGASIQSHSQSESVVSDNLPKSLGIVPNSSNEDMESSGIYSDFEKKDSIHESNPIETPPKTTEEVTSYLGLITEQMKTIQKYIKDTKFRHDEISEGMVKSSSGESSSTVQENPSSVKVSPTGSTKTIEAVPIERKDTVKRNKTPKMPNRNVTSKIKALIESPKQETEMKPKTVKKGKWDAVMDKIAQGKEENKYTPSRFRDIKSKVFQNVAPLFNPKKSDSLDSEGSPRTSSNSSLKGRSRRSTRVRSSESSLVSPKLKQSRKSTSPNSSQRSSLSDISVSTASHQNKNVNRVSKKRDSCSPQSNASTNSGNTPTRQAVSHEGVTPPNRGSFRHSDIQNGNVIRTPSSGTTIPTMKTPPIRKAPTPRTIGHHLQRIPSAPLKDSNQNGIVNKSASASTITAVNNNNNNNKIRSLQGTQNRSPRTGNRPIAPAQPRNQISLTAVAKENAALLKQLKHSSKAFESLAVLFKYCTNDLDAFSTPHLKRDLEEMQLSMKRLQEELGDRDNLITDLKNDNTSLSEESDKFKKLTESLQLEESDLKNKLTQFQDELKIVSEQKNQAESELLKEIEKIRCLKREISERTEKLQNERDGLICRLQETEKENGVLKSANGEIKTEYDKCLSENQRLVNVCSKMRNERVVSERVEENKKESVFEVRCQNGDVERSPERIPLSPQKSRTPVVGSLCSTPDRLESEVNSLQAVLALKTNQVTELRRQLLLVQESADRVPKLVSTITMLEGKVEDLQTQLSSQTETVRELYNRNEHLEEELKSANIQKTRLAHKNEELQYKLKQYAEAMKQMVNHKNLSEGDIKSQNSILKTPRKEEDNLDDTVRSQMLGVVEKSDSVSYMLEMTEDTSEIVSNIIRRAESMRSSSRNQSLPKKKRSKTSSMSSTDTDFSVGTPATPKRLEGLSFGGENFHPSMISTPTLSPTAFDFDGHNSFSNHLSGAGREDLLTSAISPIQYPINKTVKLNQNDFATDSIELATDNDCEIIEITQSFDKTDKNAEMVTSTSSSMSSSSNGSHFDIESDICSNLDNDQNLQEIDENTESSEVQENGGIIRTFRREAENIKPVLPIYKDIDANEDHSSIETDEGDVKNAFLAGSKSFIKIPKISGGEAMIGLSSDDEEVDKIK